MSKQYNFQLTENDYELIISGLQVYGNFHWDIFTTTTNEEEKAFSESEWQESIRTLHEIQTQWRLMPNTTSIPKE